MSVRLDLWLWATRFYKTRSLAVAAIKSGKVLVNLERVKPARNIVIDDELMITKQQEMFKITVLGLIEKRVSATLAQEHYIEDEDSRIKRIDESKLRSFGYHGAQPPNSRPSGKDRGRIRRFQRKE